MKQESEVLYKRGEFYQDYSNESTPQQVKLEELPLFTFNNLAIATENFHSTNKLGQGGFGLVYKVNVHPFEALCCLLKNLM